MITINGQYYFLLVEKQNKKHVPPWKKTLYLKKGGRKKNSENV